MDSGHKADHIQWILSPDFVGQLEFRAGDSHVIVHGEDGVRMRVIQRFEASIETVYLLYAEYNL
jgi:hypothetical protein